MDEIKAGDVVQLKSGGPKMTVRSVTGRECKCQWFDESKLTSGMFRLASLIKVEEDEKGEKNSR